jgi:hypothetical protein
MKDLKHIKRFNESEENLNIPDVIGSYKNGVEWFEKLSPYHREKVREKYHLKSPTLKITDEMLNDIYQKELKLPKWQRFGDLY